MSTSAAFHAAGRSVAYLVRLDVADFIKEILAGMIRSNGLHVLLSGSCRDM